MKLSAQEIAGDFWFDVTIEAQQEQPATSSDTKSNNLTEESSELPARVDTEREWVKG